MKSIVSFRSVNIIGVRAKIFEQTYDGTTRSVYGYLVDHDGKRIERVTKVKKKVSNTKDLQRVIDCVKELLREKYLKTYCTTKPLSLGKTDSLCALYDSLTDKSILNRSWGASTARSYHSYFRLNVLPQLDEALEKNGFVDNLIMSTIATNLSAKSQSRKSCYGDENSINRFQAKLEVMNHMLSVFYANVLPQEIIIPMFPIIPHGRAKQRPQVKWIPQNVRNTLSSILLARARFDRDILGCALMFCGGLRPSEAAAVLHGDIRVYDRRWAAIYVEKRIDDYGNTVSLLKTNDSYRIVVFDFFFVKLLEINENCLRRLGYSESEILSMPVFDLNGASSSKLSAYCKALLLESGVGQEELDNAQIDMLRVPDIVDNKAETDVCAYVLRRDWATRAVACGLAKEDVDYLLGHKNEKIKPGKHLTKTKQKQIVFLLEEYTYHPSFSYHPAYTPIETIMEVRIKLDPRTDFQIKNTNTVPVQVEIELETTEPGDELRIISPRKLKKAGNDFCLEDSLEDRAGRHVPLKAGAMEGYR